MEILRKQPDIYNQTTELPRLILRKVTGSNDYTKEEIHLEASGFTIEEAKQGMEYLLKKVN